MNNRLGRWANPQIKVRMLTGKSRGLEFELPDNPLIIERHGERLLVTLPGMQGEAVQLPEKAESN